MSYLYRLAPSFFPALPRGLQTLLVALLVLGRWATAQAQEPEAAAEVEDVAGEESSGPSATARREAAEHFRRGIELYHEGAFDGALIEFQAAYDTAPTWRVRFNMGQVRYQMRDYAGALREFELYLAEGGPDVSEEQQREVEREMVRLRSRIGGLEVEANVEGATVFVDGERLGPAPLRRQVNIGRHEVRVEARGHQTRAEVVTVASGDDAHLSVELEPLVSAAVAPVAPAAPPNRTRPVVLGLTGSVAAAGVVTMAAGLALYSSRQGELDDLAGTFPGDAAAVGAAYDDVQTAALITDIGIGVAAVGALAFVALLIALPDDEQDDEPSDAAPAAETSFDVGPGGFVLRRTF